MSDICFWSIGDGSYAPILQSLVYSFRQVGMQEDFHAISDRQINGATTHIAPSFSKGRHFHFKYGFLVEMMQQLDYRYFVYLDADNFFLRKPPNLLELIDGYPLVCFLESDCTSQFVKRQIWTHIRVKDYISLMREIGIKDQKIYNVNGGFFIVKKESITDLYTSMVEFWNCAKSHGFFISDEPALAYAMYKLTGVHDNLLLKNNFNIWASDWNGQFNHCLPYQCEWPFIDYMTGEKYIVNPAIIHGLHSKDALGTLGVTLL